MISKLITTIVYLEFDEALGPSPKIIFPSDYPFETAIKIGIKAFTILTTEAGSIPKSLNIIPFPSLNSKALIKYLEWPDKNLRGGIGNAAIVTMFNEADDVIFYKYIKEFNHNFNLTADKIIEIKRDVNDIDKISKILQLFTKNIENKLNALKEKEESSTDSHAFPLIDPRKPEDYQFKIALCGDAEVGKTSLVLRYTNNAFRRSYLPTLGVNVSSKLAKAEAKIIKLVIWDIAGQSKFERMRADFYQGSKCMLFVFDLCNLRSFENIRAWYLDIKSNMQELNEIGYLIGNKADKQEIRAVSKDEAFKLANELNLKYIETSALNGINVDELFYNIAIELYNLYK